MKMCIFCNKNKKPVEMSIKCGEHTNKCKACKSKDQMKYYEKQKFHFPFKNYLRSLKQRCKQNKIAYDLTAKHLQDIWNGMCPVFGMNLIWSHDQTNDESCELDRINPLKGYVVGNVRWISRKANRLKQDSTIEELNKIISYMKQEAPIYNLPEDQIILDGISLQERKRKYVKKSRVRQPGAKLTEQQVIEILQLINDGVKQKTIAEKFNIDVKNVWKIKTGRSWKHIKRQETE